MRKRADHGRRNRYLRLYDKILFTRWLNGRRCDRRADGLFGKDDILLVDKKDAVIRHEECMRLAEKRVQLDDKLSFVPVPYPAFDLIKPTEPLEVIFGISGDLAPDIQRNIFLIRG